MPELFPPYTGPGVSLSQFKSLTRLAEVMQLPAEAVYLLNPADSVDGYVFRLVDADGTMQTLKVFKKRSSGKLEFEALTILRHLVSDEQTTFSIANVSPGPLDRSYYLDNVIGRDMQSVLYDTKIASQIRSALVSRFIANTERLLELIRARAMSVAISWAKGEPLSSSIRKNGVIEIVCPLGIHYSFDQRESYLSVLPSNVIVDACDGSMTIVDTV